MSKIVKEFSRYANLYNQYNIIQNRVANELIEEVYISLNSNIIDIGCGSGAIYKNIVKKDLKFNNFIAIDYSDEMLKIHPKDKKVKKVVSDFNSLGFLDFLDTKNNTIISSSALQWSNNLNLTLNEISKKTDNIYFTIFTSNTFKTLHKIANIKSPIHKKEELLKAIPKFFNATLEVKSYKLYFKTPKEMLSYIKNSGVRGGDKKMSIEATKRVLKEYPLDYLEFEVLFVYGNKN